MVPLVNQTFFPLHCCCLLFSVFQFIYWHVLNLPVDNCVPQETCRNIVPWKPNYRLAKLSQWRHVLLSPAGKSFLQQHHSTLTMDPVYMSSFNGTYDLVLLDREWQISLVILFSFTAVLSLVSNVLAIYILLNQDCFTMSELWKYLINLSIADILMALVCIPVRLPNLKSQQLH